MNKLFSIAVIAIAAVVASAPAAALPFKRWAVPGFDKMTEQLRPGPQKSPKALPYCCWSKRR